MISNIFLLKANNGGRVTFFVKLILLTGIPHGSLDHLIQEANDKRQNRVYDFAKFIVKYLLLMAVYGLAWYWFSGISLMVFLIISAWHFGETDLENVPLNHLLNDGINFFSVD